MINDRRITPAEISYNLRHLKQLTLEVTNSCNLECDYCAYRDLYYNDNPKRERFLRHKDVSLLFDFLAGLWTKTNSRSQLTFISFYGGEPLLNMPFIEDTVNYFKSLNATAHRFRFSVTTNAIFLNKSIEYFVKNDFHILVSMDGDDRGQSYRRMKSGDNSFNKVYSNLQGIKTEYPHYFKDNISFNAVVHNKNDDAGIIDFFTKEFGKVPRLSEISQVGVRPEMADRFSMIHRNVQIDDLLDREDLIDRTALILNDPRVKETLRYIHYCSGNAFNSTSDLLINHDMCHVTPTGTCSPFSKKLYVSVYGQILPCEKVSHKYELGRVSEKELILDLNEIANKTNFLFDKVQIQCELCARKSICKQCIYHINSISDDKPCCGSYMDEHHYSLYLAWILSVLKEHRDIYQLLMSSVTIQ